MAAKEQKLFVFANLDAEWVPSGQLTLTEDGAKLLASTFAYGLRYLQRPNALEVDPVSLSIQDKSAAREARLSSRRITFHYSAEFAMPHQTPGDGGSLSLASRCPQTVFQSPLIFSVQAVSA
jgi:hypothetical protein